MTARARQSLALVLAGATALLIACNALVGVEDVTLKDRNKRAPGADGGTAGDDDDDVVGINPVGDGGTKPAVDRGTLALGYNHGCARLPNGTVRCWGDNGAGQLGDGLPYDSTARVDPALAPQPVPNLSGVVDIASGLAHTCALRKSGTVACWGVNTFGQLGDGTSARSSVPLDVLSVTDGVALGGGESFNCAVLKDKTVACWGANYSGQHGDGTKSDAPSITTAKVTGIDNAVALTGAHDHACALLETGEVMCWGGNTDGQLGIGSMTESLVPTKLTGLSNIAQVAAAARFTCAREHSGRVLCWGRNDYGQLGNGNPNADPNPSPIIVPSVGDAIFLWAGFEHACAVRKSGAVFCWGRANDGQLGNGSTADPSAASPVAVLGLPGPMAATWTGGNRSCAIAEEGHAFCWGQNALGQLGNGSVDASVQATGLAGFP